MGGPPPEETGAPPPPAPPPETEKVGKAEQNETLKKFLEKNQGAIAEAAANRVKPERMLKLALTIATRAPLLVHPKMDKMTVLRAVVDTASLGLDLSPGLGEAYLVPYWSTARKLYECQLIIGYRGIVRLARRSDAIIGVDARPVFHGEQFEPHYGSDPKIIHIPRMDVDRLPDALIAVYTVWKLVGGEKQIDIMSKAEVDAIRKRSKAADSGPWVTDYVEMAKKTDVRRSSKMVPLEVEAADAIDADARREYGDLEIETVTDDVRPTQPTRRGAGEVLATAINTAHAKRELTEGTGPAQPLVQDRGSVADMELVEVTATPVEELREQIREVETRPAEAERSQAELREEARDLYRRLMVKKLGGQKMTPDELKQLSYVRQNFPEILVEEASDVDTEQPE